MISRCKERKNVLKYQEGTNLMIVNANVLLGLTKYIKKTESAPYRDQMKMQIILSFSIESRM